MNFRAKKREERRGTGDSDVRREEMNGEGCCEKGRISKEMEHDGINVLSG